MHEKKAQMKRREGEREVKRDLKPTSTSYSNEGVTTEIGIVSENREARRSHLKLKRADSGWRKRGEGQREEESGSKSGGVEGGWVSRRLVVIQV